VSKLFQSVIRDERLNKFQPSLFVGHSAKKYIKEFVKEVLCEEDYHPFKSFSGERGDTFKGACGCDGCEYSYENILELNGNEVIEEFRNRVQEFSRKNRYELRFIVCNNIERLNKETLDTFLKTLEEPKENVKILASAFEIKNIPRSILSRFHIYFMDELNKEEILYIVENNEIYKPYKNSIQNMEFPIRSIEEIIIIQKFSFEENFKVLFEGNNIVEFENKFNNMIQTFKDDNAYKFEQIISEFLKYYIYKVSKYKMKKGTFLFWVNNIIDVNFRKLFEVINTDKKYMISVDEQLKNFFRSCFIVRSILGN
jgi:hypothetical protein